MSTTLIQFMHKQSSLPDAAEGIHSLMSIAWQEDQAIYEVHHHVHVYQVIALPM